MLTWLIRLHQQDERLLRAVIDRRGRGLDTFMGCVTHLGGTVAAVGVAMLMLSGLDAVLRSAGVLAAFALVTSHLAVQVLKRGIARPRPHLPVGYESLARAPDRFSFPSGHSAAALSVALPLAGTLSPLSAYLVLALALLVGFSRCYLGVHYPGDVVAVWVLALLALSLGGALF